jgi:hypothetical protein
MEIGVNLKSLQQLVLGSDPEDHEFIEFSFGDEGIGLSSKDILRASFLNALAFAGGSSVETFTGVLYFNIFGMVSRLDDQAFNYVVSLGN